MSKINENIPFEVTLETARSEIVRAVNSIGASYNIPSTILNMILADIVNEVKVNTLTTIIANYDIELPEGAVQNNPQPSPTPNVQSHQVKTNVKDKKNA